MIYKICHTIRTCDGSPHNTWSYGFTRLATMRNCNSFKEKNHNCIKVQALAKTCARICIFPIYRRQNIDQNIATMYAKIYLLFLWFTWLYFITKFCSFSYFYTIYISEILWTNFKLCKCLFQNTEILIPHLVYFLDYLVLLCLS